MTPKSPEHSAIESLRRALTGVSGPFACGGSIAFTQPITFHIAGAKPIKLNPPPADDPFDWRGRERGDRFAAAIAKQCTPAPFGLDNETRIDPAVRDALQLRAENDSLRIDGLDEALTDALDATRDALAPDDPNPLRAELYALNVYRRKGHFVRHKDTPRGADMLGTLVLNLPTRYAGGALCVGSGGEERRFFKRHWHSAEPPPRIEWAAFYGDVDHEVQPITDGARVTLTWLLRRSAGAEGARAKRTGSSREAFAGALRHALADATFAPTGARIGVPCVHMYSQSRDAPLPRVALDAKSALALKGRDQSVALAALDVGLEVTMQAVMAENCAEQEWTLKRFLTAREASLFAHEQVDDFEIEERLPIAQKPDERASIDIWIPQAPVLETARARTPFGGSPAMQHLGHVEYSSTGYFGNEAGDADFYAYALLEIVVPPARKRSRPAKRP